MKKTIFLSLVASMFLACGGSGNRFAGKTEAEMFTIVQDELCDLLVSCESSVTKQECIEMMDDSSAYSDPIDEPTREKINACLDVLVNGAADCEIEDDFHTEVCQEVENYFDLK